jgi:hypothetical protein
MREDLQDTDAQLQAGPLDFVQLRRLSELLQGEPVPQRGALHPADPSGQDLQASPVGLTHDAPCWQR